MGETESNFFCRNKLFPRYWQRVVLFEAAPTRPSLLLPTPARLRLEANIPLAAGLGRSGHLAVDLVRPHVLVAAREDGVAPARASPRWL